MRRFFQIHAGMGFVAWGLWTLYAVVVGMPSPDPLFTIVEGVLLFAILVLVPLGLASIAPERGDGLWTAVRVALPFGSLSALAALSLPQGVAAGVVSLGWVAVTALLALLGVRRVVRQLRARALGPVHELAIDAALIYVSVGGAFLFQSRMGMELMGFGHLIVLLTAIHYHYAGFVVPLLAGLSGRVIEGRARPVYVAATAAVVAGPPMQAAGIALWPLLEIVAAFVLVAGLLTLGALMATVAGRRSGRRLTWALLVLSALSLLPSMAGAGLYAVGEWLTDPLISTPNMVALHGAFNAFGFSLLGLLAWNLARAGRTP